MAVPMRKLKVEVPDVWFLCLFLERRLVDDDFP
jgi:hypothetical protein